MEKNKNFTTVFALLLIFITCLYAINGLMPTVRESKTPVPDQFSLENALAHVKMISMERHYVGAPGHADVRNYILGELEKMGLDTQVQESYALGKKFRTGSRVQNILARVEGKQSGKSLVLLSHYDSGVYSSLGASDAGSGVATILEGLRAFLAKGEQPDNDIIVLITDAEEIGLLGAQAFVEKHPWAKDVGLVLNFEARGSGGPSFMFMETNGGNQGLIESFNQTGTSHPVSNSLLYSLYKLMPNDTDLTVFRELADINGFNFAFIDDHFDYHTSRDSYERLDRNSLQHQASYLMPALAYFARADLDEVSATDEHVFFNFPRIGLVHFPFDWVAPLSWACFIGLVILLFIGFKAKKLSVMGVLAGFLPLLISLALVGLLAHFGWQLLTYIHPDYQDMLHGFTYNGHHYITAFIALSVWIGIWIYSLFTKKWSVLSLYVPVLFLWLLLCFSAATYLPGAGFVLIPLLTGMALLALGIFYRRSSDYRVLLGSILALPFLIVFVPMSSMFAVGLGLKMLTASTIFSLLILVTLTPVFTGLRGLKNLNKFFLVVGILSLISAEFSAGFNEEQKKPDSIVYVHQRETGKAYWATTDRQVDEYTDQFLGSDPEPGSFASSDMNQPLLESFTWHKEAPDLGLQAAEVKILQESIMGDVRTLRIRLLPKRSVNRLDVRIAADTRVIDLEVQGELIKGPEQGFLMEAENGRRLFRYYFTAPDEWLEFQLRIPASDDADLYLLEASFDLLDHPGLKQLEPNVKERPEHLMEKPFILNDALVVTQKIDL